MELSQPFAIAAAIGMAGFVAWLIRDVLADLRKDRDQWRSIAESAVVAFDRLADQLDIEPVVKPGRKQ